MALLSVGGLASGLDTDGLVKKLIEAERRPVTLLEGRKQRLDEQDKAFQDLNTKLLTLKSQADALKDPAKFYPRAVTSSDETVAKATATPGSARGTYAVTVTQLARGSIATAGVTKASLTDTIAAGTGNFEFKLGATGPVVTVPVTVSTTLEQLVKDINDKNAGVKAAAINVGTSVTPAYKLTLTSVSTGAANNIVVVTDNTNITIALGDEGTTDLTVDVSAAGLQSVVQGLVNAYNDLVKAVTVNSTVIKTSAGTVIPAPFTGEILPRAIMSSLTSAIGFTTSGAVDSLVQLGITRNSKDGLLTLDAGKFQNAVTANVQATSDLIAGTSTTDGVADLLSKAADAATKSVTGGITVRREGLTSTTTSLQKQIDAMLDRLTLSEQRIRSRFIALERTINQLQQTQSSLSGQMTSLQNLARSLSSGR